MGVAMPQSCVSWQISAQRQRWVSSEPEGLARLPSSSSSQVSTDKSLTPIGLRCGHEIGLSLSPSLTSQQAL
jgi:hypothetical protein